MANARIWEDYEEIKKNPLSNCGVTVRPEDNDPTRWKACILGPKDTSYKGGLFHLLIQFPPNYPQKAPEVCFLTPVYHVNVNPKVPTMPGGEPLGHVGISTLNWWKPENTIRELLTHIFTLFYKPNPDSPYGLDRAEELRNNRELYERKIKYFTKKYADVLSGRNKFDRDHDWDFTIPS